MAKEKARDLRAGVALLWGEQDQPTRGPKPSLTPHRIAEAAVAIADAEGLDAVAMSKVAAEFGVSAMALYRYVPGKAELVQLMVESVLAPAPDLSAVGEGWRPQIIEWARRSAKIHRSHPWLLAATAMRRQLMGPNQLAWLDAALAALEPAGLTAAQQHRVFVLVAGLVRTLVQQQLDFDEEHSQEWIRLTGELLGRHADRFPALTRAIAAGAFAPDTVDPLEFGLDRILDGVQTLIDRA
ncbi:TetR/AcrR family transcriptional regulator C-terminal domain-containing protein [Kitasatospora sp. GP82]|uniref:TetR/AcrR family transcriptional regulator n=1 Tax=Kitasatospora sp. GP82 TaxID=3035089 RepID=UPI002476A8FE|nr:TetR/AcrR family transcriptional regulator C-terminal domain-containing protein [Kitasatospora sp. GP82]MDH6123476.1 AcrR family transcriptional regulator [Kitasatospora sp. GP82]